MPWWLDIPDTSSQKHANDDKRKLCLGRKGKTFRAKGHFKNLSDQGQRRHMVQYSFYRDMFSFLISLLGLLIQTDTNCVDSLTNFWILCLVEASFHSLPLSSHSILPVWVSASKFLLFIKTSVILDLEPTLLWSGLPGSSDDKEFTCSERDLGLIHGLGRSPKERNGSPLQYSCLANPMDRGTW